MAVNKSDIKVVPLDELPLLKHGTTALRKTVEDFITSGQKYAMLEGLISKGGSGFYVQTNKWSRGMVAIRRINNKWYLVRKAITQKAAGITFPYKPADNKIYPEVKAAPAMPAGPTYTSNLHHNKRKFVLPEIREVVERFMLDGIVIAQLAHYTDAYVPLKNGRIMTAVRKESNDKVRLSERDGVLYLKRLDICTAYVPKLKV